MTIPVIDAHNDLLLELDWRRDEPHPFTSTWLPNLERGGVMLQVCPLYTAQPEWLPELALRQAMRQLTAYLGALAEPGGRAIPIRTVEDLNAIDHPRKIGLMLSMEGVEPLGYDPHLIDVFWELGVRMVSLTWNRRNPFADGLAEPNAGGLSRLGQELVDRMVERGLMLDLAHASERTFDEVVERAGDACLLVSHAACRSVLDTPRNLSDRQLRILADHDGVLGIMLLPIVIDPTVRTLDRAVAHIAHAVDVMGIEHVGFGGDFIAQVAESLGWTPTADSLSPEGLGFSESIESLRGPDGYQRLLERLGQGGFTDDALRAIAHGNLLRLFKRGLPQR